jgi:hypothetical protein
MVRRLAMAAVVAAAVSAGCDTASGPAPQFVVSGPVQNNTQAAIPAGARVVVVWGVSSTSPDYSYVFGEGSLSPDGTSFQVRFDQPPPVEALNGAVLGVGMVVVTTNQAIGTGDDLSTIPQSDIIGVAGQYGVIYVADPDKATQVRGWAAEFPRGLSVGIGVSVPDSAFDKFAPESPSNVVLIIDDLANIHIVNWT